MERNKNILLKFTIMSLLFLVILLTKNNIYAATRLNNSKATIEKASYKYTGSEIRPKVTVKNNSNKKLTEGVDYTVKYENNINVTPTYYSNEARVIIKGKGSYTGTVTKYFTIKTLDLSQCSVELEYTSCQYNFYERKPNVTLKSPDGLIVNSKIYKVSYRDNIKPSKKAKVNITAASGYSGSVYGTNTTNFTINKRNLNNKYIRITLSQDKYVCDWTERKPTVTVQLNVNGGYKTVSSTHYTVSYSDNKYPNSDTNTPTVTIRGKGNYFTGSVTKNFTIDKRNIDTALVTLNKMMYTYNGLAKTPTIESIKIKTDAGRSLNVSKNYYNVSYSNNINAGTASLIITGKGNFKGTKKVNFIINKRNVDRLDISLQKNNTYIYDGSEKEPRVTVLMHNGYYYQSLSKNTDYTLTYENNVDAGTASAILKGKGNYTGTKKLNFTIKYPEKIKNILEKAEEIDTYMAMNKYDYCVGDTKNCNHKNGNQCGLVMSFTESQKIFKNTCCATYVSWVLMDTKDAEYMDTPIHGAHSLINYLSNHKAFEEVKNGKILAGDILYYSKGHVDIAANDGGTQIYNEGDVDYINQEGTVTRYSTPSRIIRVKN